MVGDVRVSVDPGLAGVLGGLGLVEYEPRCAEVGLVFASGADVEADLAGGEFVGDRSGVGQGPGETVELGDHERVTGPGRRRGPLADLGVPGWFDEPVIQRCQLHKIRNVESKLPKALASSVAKKMRVAYHDPDFLAAEATLEDLARQLHKSHPGAAASLREGLSETLTITRLGVPPTLARTLRSTNAVESMIEICRDHASNVKGWRDGQMALRWCAAGMVEATKQFRRVNGFLHLPALRSALERHVAGVVTSLCEDEHTAA